VKLTFANAAAVPAGVWAWPHVLPNEWADRQDGSIVIETDFMDRLERLRARFGKPFLFNSCYRTPAHNVAVSAVKSDDGPHTLGLACDIRVTGGDVFRLIQLAIAEGFTGIGVSQKIGSAVDERYVHLDMAPNRPQAPRPLVWSY
jgi:uncharacterized protein YcbK (DUF882 family)